MIKQFTNEDTLPEITDICIATGKTKDVYASTEEGYGYFVSNDILSKQNGLVKVELPGKGALANKTTSHVFSLLNECKIPTSFVRQAGETSFFGKLCDMISYEVVVSREAFGSYCKQNPQCNEGDVLQTLEVRFFLKTTGAVWNGIKLPDDDMLIVIKYGKGYLYDPTLPINGQKPIAIIEDYPLWDKPKFFDQIIVLAKKAFLAYEKAWQVASGNWWRIVDVKFEFGFDMDGNLVLADVVDSDSGRVKNPIGENLSKQSFRDGAPLPVVYAQYQLAEQITSRFMIPKQQKVIIWRGSAEKDNVTFIEDYISKALGDESGYTEVVTCSMHKQPIKGVNIIVELTQRYPSSVVIAYIGMSNGAGPILSTQCPVTVINVPASADKHPEDIASSSRMPSKVPCVTVLNGENAALAALKILAMSNPYVYMCTRFYAEGLISAP